MLIDGNPLERPAPPLDELLRAGLEAGPDEVALVSATRSLSWRQLEEESARLAGGYRGLGLEPGDRVASLMPNRIDLVVHYLACFKAGLVATPLNYRYTAPRDRPRARGQRRPRPARPRRAGRGRRAPASWPAASSWGRSPTGAELEEAPAARVGARVRGAAGGRAAGRRRPTARPRRAGGDLLHLGQHRPGQGRHPHPRVAALDDRQRRRRLRADAEDVFLPGSSMSHIGSFLWALSTLSVGGQRGRRAHHRQPRAAAAAARAPADACWR